MCSERLPPAARSPRAGGRVILDAIANRIDVVAGMHVFLGDHPELARTPRRGLGVIDRRRPPDDPQLTTGEVLDLGGSPPGASRSTAR